MEITKSKLVEYIKRIRDKLTQTTRILYFTIFVETLKKDNIKVRFGNTRARILDFEIPKNYIWVFINGVQKSFQNAYKIYWFMNTLEESKWII